MRTASDDLAYLGFRVAGADEFAQMQRQLSEAGIKFRVGSEDEADERRVLEVLKLSDPDGNPVEIFHGPLMQFSKPFHPGRAMHGRFKTGTGGLGHCIVREGNVDAAQRFYAHLGMRGGVEYKFRAGKRTVGLVFMHCNDRDHTVAFGIPGGDRRLNHIMIEVDNLDDVGMTYDLVRKNKIPVTYHARQALERSHVLILLPQSVRLDVRIRLGRAPGHLSSPNTSAKTSTATTPKPAASKCPPKRSEHRELLQ